MGNTQTQTTVTIIIAHHKGELVYRCLHILRGTSIDITVVTSDPSFYHPYIRTIHTNQNNPAFKRNLGSLFSKTDYLCFMDDDVEVGEYGIRQMQKYLDEHPETGMVYAQLHKMDNPTVVDTAGSWLTGLGFLHESYKETFSAYPILSAKSALCMVRRKAFEEVGGFDPTYCIYGEETDLSWRLWQKWYRVELLPLTCAYHAFETPLKPRSYYNPYYIHYHGCKNYITTLLKNLPKRRLYIALVNALCWFVVGVCMLPRNRKAGKWILEGIGYNITHFGEIWKKRQKVVAHSYWRLVYKNPPLSYYLTRFFEYLFHQLHGKPRSKSTS